MSFVFVSSTEVRVSETAGTAVETISRTGSLDGDVTITYGVTGNTATDGEDFVGGFFTATMPAGVDQIQVPVTILDDALPESTETLTFSIVTVDNATLFAPRTSLISILDDETPAPPPPEEPPLVSNYDVTQIPVATGLDQPIRLMFSPIDPTKMYVAEKPGDIKVVDVTTGDSTTLLDIRDQTNEYGDRGILGVALHPDLVHNPYIYVTHTVDPADTAGNTGLAGADGGGNRYVQLVRYTLDAATNYTTVVDGSATVLLGGGGHSLADISGNGALDFTDPANGGPSSERYIDPAATDTPVVIDGIKQDYWKDDSTSHVGGSLAFGPDGMLYVGTGDGTSFDYADPRSPDVQDLDSLSGKILRIDPMTGLGLADNPFVTADTPLDSNQAKVFQLGLRNPFSIDFGEDGRLIITDTGWNSWEEINTGGPGANFGWPYYEGADNGVLAQSPGYSGFPNAAAFYAGVADGTIHVTPALRAFAHDSTLPGFQVQAITGGEVIYGGTAYPASLLNDFFFTDFPGGEVYLINVNDPTDVEFLYQHSGYGAPTDFIQGADGYVYYADLIGGLIGRYDISVAVTGPVDRTIGTGPDALVLKISQDAYLGDAQYTITVDGIQIGNALSAKALHASGQSDTITVLGDWGPGDHTVAVDFLNDAWGGSPDTDRNLYVDSMTYNGVPVAGGTAQLATSGPQAFAFTDTGPAAPPPVTVGTGPDTLVLKVSEDAFAGVDAQFTVSVDGVQIGGTLTTTALHSSGLSDTINVLGDWAAGDHVLSVNYVNDGGTARNLYIDGVAYDGVAVPGSTTALLDAGAQTFAFTDPGTPPPPPGTTIGSGPDTLVLKISEEAYQGDAQFTVSVDGVQIGGTLTAHALHTSGLSDTINVLGDWAPGDHALSVNFLNDAWGGTAATDRNLYVDSITYDGVAVAGGTASMQQSGPHAFTFTDTGPAAPPPVTVGAGPDTLVLELSEDAFAGVDAQFTVSVDGVQIGGTLTSHALHSSGLSDTINVLGDWAAGDHVLSVNYLNDGGTARNLYVDGITYDGVAVPAGTASLLDAGAKAFTFTDPGTPPPPPGTTIGSGPDTLTLKISEDAYQGDAQFTVSVDGVQIGGTLTAQALHSSGLSDTVNVLGNWAPGNHTVSVNFLNDAWGGTAATDRNLYVDGITYDGVAVAGGTAAMQQSGPHAFAFTDTGTATPPPVVTTIGSGPDTLALRISEDQFLGIDAQFTVSVDGAQIGGTLSAHALHSSGVSDTVNVLGDWAAGDHVVSVNYLNDGGTARALYIDGMTYDGAAVPAGTANLLDAGAQAFTFTDPGAPPPPPGTTIGSGADTLVLKISEDAWNGDAQFTVSVDGVQIGGTLTAHALHSSAASDTINVMGDWAPGNHVLSVDFLNDAWGGTAATDRNLYVDGVTYDGVAVPGGTAAMPQSGPHAFAFTDTGSGTPPPPSPGATTDIGAGAQTIVLKLNQDAYLGNAQYTVTVDGVQIGGTQSATALHSSGTSDTVNVHGTWAAGNHTVAVNFLNDAWGGSTALDRNLYVESLDYGATHIAGNLAVNNAANGMEATDPTGAVMAIDGTAAFQLLV
ncbi:MAG: carbohydrate-binding domain-containing protein [Gemmatimonas sp.]